VLPFSIGNGSIYIVPFSVFMYICIVYMLLFKYTVYIFPENRTNGKWNFRLFAANGNGKQKFVFLGRQMINVNRRLLFQRTCPSMQT
jgi:hypothetical protein